ncbi:MAG: ABC-2 family transporter protein [Clostridia bacterium]|nr:ABC-2 family transporter protein [Clostridia bacterium]
MSSYLGLFKMTFKGELQYRAKAISGVFTQVFWGLMYIYLYTAFMGGKIIEGFSIAQMISYVWIGQAFFVLRFTDLPKNCAKEIENGNVCYKFVRPVDLYNQWYTEHFGYKLAATLIRCVPLTIVAFLLPPSMRLMLPTNFASFMLFAVALLIGALITSAISMITVFLTFKTMSAKGTATIINTICGVLGGMYVPLVFMPQSLQNVLSYLPFRFIMDLPARIYVGNIPPIEALKLIAIAVAWLIILVLVGKLLMKQASKNTIIQGG